MSLNSRSQTFRLLASKAYRARIRHLPLSRFDRAFSKVEPFAMVGPRHLAHLYRGTQAVIKQGIPGGIVECGCARGGSAALLGFALRDLGPEYADRKVWLYDTFEGLPEPSANDPDYERAIKFVGTCRGDLQSVRALMADFGLLDMMVFVKGLFCDTLPEAASFPIALLHIDGDWYESVKTCLDELYRGISPGGIVQIDDYLTWEGCKKAVDEFVEHQNGSITLQKADQRSVWFRKP